MFLKSLFAVAAAGAFLCVQAADFSKIYEVKRWSPAECTMTNTTVAGKPAFIVNMPIDHKGGEKKYPIGWPRTYLEKMNANETDWKDASKLTFKIKLEFTGTTARYPIQFHVFSKGQKKSVPTNFQLTNNAEKEYSVDLSRLPSKEVYRIGFSISESNFKHGENFKFTVSDFKLVK